MVASNLLLTSKQKSYVKSDVTKLDRLYDESLKLKQEYDRNERMEKNKKLAKEAAVAISAIICDISVGRASNFSCINEAKSIYESLYRIKYENSQPQTEKLNYIVISTELNTKKILVQNGLNPHDQCS